eukprot:10686681-Karenia_brevis.AAC.1
MLPSSKSPLHLLGSSVQRLHPADHLRVMWLYNSPVPAFASSPAYAAAPTAAASPGDRVAIPETSSSSSSSSSPSSSS